MKDATFFICAQSYTSDDVGGIIVFLWLRGWNKATELIETFIYIYIYIYIERERERERCILPIKVLNEIKIRVDVNPRIYPLLLRRSTRFSKRISLTVLATF